MKERPILFSGPMVRAILDGRKTQTRRVVKPQPETATDCPYHVGVGQSRKSRTCPYGTVGDRLWVREAWLPFDQDHVIGDCKVAYMAEATPTSEEIRKEYIREGRNYRWRPSIHMPRWASRITLEITGVRVERLQEISETDAIAEGAMSQLCSMHDQPDAMKFTHRNGFTNLWQSINGPESWASNPWVWVIEFRRLGT